MTSQWYVLLVELIYAGREILKSHVIITGLTEVSFLRFGG